MVGYYVDGKWAVTESVVRARFPTAILVGISAVGTDAGKVGDVETGDLTPAQIPGWCAMRRRAGETPVAYCNRGNLAAVRWAFAAQRIPPAPIWLSTLDGSLPWQPDVVAIQFQGESLTGGHYDCSVVSDRWPGPLPAGGFMDIQQVYDELRGDKPHSKLDILLDELRGQEPNSKLDLILLLLRDQQHGLAALRTELDVIKAGVGAAGGAPIKSYDLTITPKP